MKLLLAAMLAIGLLAMPAQEVAACSCAAFGVEEAAAVADAVFAGTVVGEQPVDAGRGSGRPVAATVPFPAPMPGQIIYTFEVDGVAKGDIGATAEVLGGGDGASCGMSFGMNERWLVFATWDGAMLSTGLCSGNLMLAAGEEAPVPLTSPGSDAAVADEGSGVPIAVILVLGALALIVAASFVAFRRDSPQAG